MDDLESRVRQLRERFPRLEDPPSDDICYATQNRQVAVKAIASECDLMLIVGSPNSSNSVRLVEVAKQAGAPEAHLLDRATDLRLEWLVKVETIGVSSGASVPEVLVSDLLARLDDLGWKDVEEVVTTQESYRFAQPRMPER